MRNSICLNRNWTFYGPKGTPETINLPHTWNAVDGQGKRLLAGHLHL